MHTQTRTLIAAAASALLTATLATSASAATARAATTGSPGPGTCSEQIVPAPASQGSNQLYYDPEPGGSDAQFTPAAGLDSVSAISPSDVWFTGNDTGSPWVLHWNGSSVTPAPPVPQGPGADISGLANGSISFSSDTDGWLLTQAPYYGFQVADHWDGSRWTMIQLAMSPDPANEGVDINQVVALSPHDAWAVGGFSDAHYVLGKVPTGVLVEHWDGTQWSVVPNPDSGVPGALLSALTVVSPGDIWAAGRSDDSAGNQVPLVMHWDGTAWSEVSVPAGTGGSELGAVTATGPDDIWVVGAQTEPGTQDTALPLAEHWNGTTWTVQQLPDTGNSLLWGVAAASGNDVWATAEIPGGTEEFFLHWDGTAWTSVQAPGPKESGLSYLYSGIGGTGPADIWAAGYVYNTVYKTTAPQIARLSCS
jgi:hypothetical protein